MDIDGSMIRSFREKSRDDMGWINGGFMVEMCIRDSTYTVAVVVLAMCSNQLFRASGFYHSVCRNHIVVTTALPAQ